MGATQSVDPGPPARILPLLGRVAAGRPIEAIATPESVEVPETLLRGDNNFALRVVGDSMVDDGIRDGDIVIVQQQRDAKNGQTVVALVNHEATIKRYFKKGTHIELQPANEAMQPIIVHPSDEFHIEGLVIGVIRHCAV